MSLAAKGVLVFKEFDRMLVVAAEVHSDGLGIDIQNLQSERDRFEIWAVDLGLLIPGHGSLDYRVSGAHSLTDALLSFLSDLVDSLHEIVKHLEEYRQELYGIIPGATRSQFTKSSELTLASEETQIIDITKPSSTPERIDNPDQETGEPGIVIEEYSDDENVGSDLELLYDAVQDIIDRLYKLATKIRNPSVRQTSRKAKQHAQVDPDTGIDLIQAYAEFDLQHVRAVYNCLSPELSESDGPDKEVLLRRLSSANTVRRQQFAYWKHSNEKKRKQTVMKTAWEHSVDADPAAMAGRNKAINHNQVSSALSMFRDGDELAQTRSEMPSITTATQLPHSLLVPITALSVKNASEYAYSTANKSHGAVDFPPPPRRHLLQKFFECPYCFTICPVSVLAEKAWKAHLIHDLKPYVCTFSQCTTSSQLFDKRAEWIEHENAFHRRKVFHCSEHQDSQFESLNEFESHIKQYHEDSASIMLAPSFIKAQMQTDDSATSSCVLCQHESQSIEAASAHMALHLERIALFSLPRNRTGDGPDLWSEIDSDQPLVNDADSRDEDFDSSDLSWKSPAVSVTDNATQPETLEQEPPVSGEHKAPNETKHDSEEWNPGVITSIDFGMASTTVAFAIGPSFSNIEMIPVWSTGEDHHQVIEDACPSEVAYDFKDKLASWGFGCRATSEKVRLERSFKTYLDPKFGSMDVNRPSHPEAVKFYCDFMTSLKSYIDLYMTERQYRPKEEQIEFVFGIPTAWARPNMLEHLKKWLHSSGFQNAETQRLVITTELKAAAAYVAATRLSRGPFMVVDIGAGTINISTFEVVGQEPSRKEIRQITEDGHLMVGSSYVDMQTRDLLKLRLGALQILNESDQDLDRIADDMTTDKNLEKFKHDLHEPEGGWRCYMEAPANLQLQTRRERRERVYVEHAELRKAFIELIELVCGRIEEELTKVAKLSIGQPLTELFILGGFGSSTYAQRLIQARFPDLTVVPCPQAKLAVAAGLIMNQKEYRGPA